MKWFIAIICGLLVLTGCERIPAPVEEKISAQRAYETCRLPEEFHVISPFTFPIAARVMRHKSCMNIDNLLMVVWYGEHSEKNMTAAKLLALMYVSNHNDNNPTDKLTAVHLLTDELKVDEMETHISFYQLKKELTGEDYKTPA